jgi:hypothetical protein
MDARTESEPTPAKNRATVERKSERELVVTRTINGPARLVFEAWTKPELFKQWWVPEVVSHVPAVLRKRMFVSGASTTWCSARVARRRSSSTGSTSK